MVEPGANHLDFPGGLGEFESLFCQFPDGITVEATRRADLPWLFIFEGRHPEHGLRYFRARRRGGVNGGDGGVEVWDVTEAVLRALARRHKRARLKAASEGKDLHARLRAAKIEPKPGSPTRERRRHGALARETIPNLERDQGGPLNVDVYRAPDRLVAMHKRGTLNKVQLEAAIRFHKVFIAGGLDPQRAANIHRIPGAGGTLHDAVLDARHEVFLIYDHVGGRLSLNGRVLYEVVGFDRAIEDCLRRVRGPDRWANKHRVVGVLASVLDSVAGYYATRARLESWRRRALRGVEIGYLSQGA